ncbi:VTC domain-containing protein [Halteromyces radiatus]|uniref:VTC domain-containing protein n=1 Tax=Halteromyces radiatus TaxID=101107 RepID=UPI00221FD023|nr:VTC domain-containing protein [Halteromyces radiatus]KAI8097463.1 VTC domain-containing protein [Halteromyces radiatus]
MKFGQELQENIYEPWRFEYVAYDVIKKDMKNRQLSHDWTDQDEKDFEAVLRLEADKVDLFITRKQREIDSRIAYCDRILVQQRPSMTLATQHSLYESMDDSLTDILTDLNDLAKFTRYNFLAFQKLIKKHDKYTHIDRQALLVDIVRNKSLDRQRFDVALVKISTLHDLCRLHGESRTGNAAAGLDQNAFERATAKYWVHPDNVTELKAILLFHLPVLVFNPNKPIEPEDSAISSVYFDNSDFDLYGGRLQRDEGAEAIRLRWYGPMSSNSIFIERKTHHAPWLDGASVKDRFRLDESQVNDFLQGRYTADQVAHDMATKQGMAQDVVEANHFIASGIQRSVAEKQLNPVMRVFYNRTAFQVPGDQRLRLSLDTDLTFIREDGNRRKNNNWRRQDVGVDYPFDYLPDNEIYRFPYAVLETKLQTHLGQEPPEWLTRLLDSKLVYEVPRFSKYLQGAAHFWSPQLPLLPWWLNDLEQLDIRNAKQVSGNFTGLSRSKSLKPLIDGRYRLGYLESQLEKRATLTRKESQAAKAKRAASLQRQNNKIPLPTTNESSEYKATVISPPVNSSTDPFADPIWRLDTTSSNENMQQYHQQQHYTAARQRVGIYDYVDGSSTEYLMGKTPRSSVMQHNNMTSQEALNGGNQQRDDVDAIISEEGGIPYSKKGKKGGGKKKKNKDRIEPKIFFANERTFIHWLYFAALLLTTALTLLNFGDKTTRISGGVFFGIAFGFAIYAFIRYRWRAHRIINKPTERYDDLYGPIGLCLLLVGALILNFVLEYQRAPDSNGYLNTGQNGTLS